MRYARTSSMLNGCIATVAHRALPRSSVARLRSAAAGHRRRVGE